MNPSPKALPDELIQELKALRADIQALPERIVDKLGDTINRTLTRLWIVSMITCAVFWAIDKFWK